MPPSVHTQQSLLAFLLLQQLWHPACLRQPVRAPSGTHLLSPCLPAPQAKWEASDNKPGLVAAGLVGLVGLYLVSGLVNT